jgi:UDP-N-acetylmuramyl pentapeptide synthase
VIPLPLDEIRAIAPGELDGSGEATGLEIDSRRVGPGDLFVAIRGGREFVADARQRGAATLVPDDEFGAMAAIGRALRSRSFARFVGVTGSTGKTSTTTPSSACRSRSAGSSRTRSSASSSSACAASGRSPSSARSRGRMWA